MSASRALRTFWATGVFLAYAAMFSRPAPAGDGAVTAEGAASRICARLNEVKTLTAGFLRTVDTAGGAVSDTTRGRIVLDRDSGRLRLELGTGDAVTDLVLLRGDSTYLYSYSLDQLIRRRGLGEAETLWKAFLERPLKAETLGDLREIRETGACVLAAVIQQPPEYPAEIQVCFDCVDLLPVSVTVRDDLGTVVRFAFTDIQANEPIPPSMFAVSIGEVTEVIDIPF